jgi:hypothetical protein
MVERPKHIKKRAERKQAACCAEMRNISHDLKLFKFTVVIIFLTYFAYSTYY